MSREHPATTINGFVALLLWFGLAGLAAWRIYAIAVSHDVGAVWQPILMILAWLIAIGGFAVVQPNEGRVLLFFGKYIGSITRAGFFYANPLAAMRPVSLKVHNFNSETLKVNDARGNPIEIAAVVVWRVTESAKALLEVEEYRGFVSIQAETALRSVAQRFPYDSHEDDSHPDSHSLRGSPDEVSHALMEELQARLEVAGVQVIDCRLSHLAYAPEIAQAMLRRQQAEAVVAARRQIVEGAVSMVEMGLRRLEEHGTVVLDDERKASMINNLLVALVADREAQPVINTGSMYS
ncbi:MAG: SPFH domain-containing protein [Myxococcales bacterium]|nr:SPFH domain-containing protein [Myxococcales bacterium]